MSFINESKLEAVVEALKEGARVIVIAVLFAVIPIMQMGIDTTIGTIAIDWNVVKAVALMTILIAVGRMLDKAKHVYLKETTPDRKEGESMGILPW